MSAPVMLGENMAPSADYLSALDTVMDSAGAFRKELGAERLFRDALAARVMAPTTDALKDFVARAALGLPLL